MQPSETFDAPAVTHLQVQPTIPRTLVNTSVVSACPIFFLMSVISPRSAAPLASTSAYHRCLGNGAKLHEPGGECAKVPDRRGQVILDGGARSSTDVAMFELLLWLRAWCVAQGRLLLGSAEFRAQRSPGSITSRRTSGWDPSLSRRSCSHASASTTSSGRIAPRRACS